LSQQSVKQSGVSFWEAFRYWLKLGFINFGGPAGQVAMMHRDLVDRRQWISDARFLHALNFCMLLPGPEAQQLAIYIGWLRRAGRNLYDFSPLLLLYFHWRALHRIVARQ
jgi:chromate transport protein ChrA